MTTDLALEVGGQRLTGWTSARVSMSLDAICPGFEVGYADRWADQRRLARIRPGQSCRLLWKGETLLHGWVDAAITSESADSRALSVRGRAKTCDLVDCSVTRTSPWEGVTIADIAKSLCSDFGLSVQNDLKGASLKALDEVWPEPGETCADLLSRVARARGTHLLTTPDGALWLVGESGMRTGAKLVRGKNILSAALTESFEQRFSSYGVVSQDEGEDGGLEGMSATAADKAIKRHRPLVVVADTAPDTLEQRAAWERNVRVGRSMTLQVETVGWLAGTSGVWRPAQIVRVTDKWLGLDADMAVTGVELSLDVQSGTRASLELTDPRALALAPDDAFDLDSLGD